MAESLREKIYNKIRRDIIIGKLSPGERLVEIKLSEELQASRGLIREALLQLTSEGFLTSQKNKGISVAKLTLKQIDEIFSLRCILESYAVRLAAERFTSRDHKQLAKMQNELIKATKNGSLADWTDINIAFHKFFIERSDNSYLIQMLDALRCRTYRYSIFIITIPGAQEIFIKDHKDIIKACKDGDPDAAQRLMHKHMENAKNALLVHLKEFPGLVS
jgi:DNA-binding GntR family transcriptional regulator